MDSALPSTRDIAQQLGINRKTVARVYDELLALGLIYTQPKRGTFVANRGLSDRLPTTHQHLEPHDAVNNKQQAIQQLIQKSVLQHTRRAALHIHKLQFNDFDAGGLHLLRQMLANQLAHEKKLLVAPQHIICSTWLALEHSLLLTLKQRGMLLLDTYTAKRMAAHLHAYQIDIQILPELSAQHSPSTLIEQIEKYCINYPVSSLWLGIESLVHAQHGNMQTALAQRIQDYDLLLIEDMQSEALHPYGMSTISVMAPQHSLLLGSLYGSYCDMFNLYFMTTPDRCHQALLNEMDIHHQQTMMLNMLAQSELLRRGDYKKLMHRIQQLISLQIG